MIACGHLFTVDYDSMVSVVIGPLLNQANVHVSMHTTM